MKRFHVHVGVTDLAQSIRFYTSLFGAEPTVRKDDYAKWMIEDPRVNFAISQRAGRAGINHLGLQADSAGELADIREHFAAAGAGVHDELDENCCYAISDKHWVADPQGIAWEGFHTRGEIRFFDGNAGEATSSRGTAESGCCAPGEPAHATATAGRSACRA